MENVIDFNHFLLAWLLYLVIQAIFINGVKMASSGSPVLLPDGTYKDPESILYPVAKFLLRTKKCKIFYKGEQFMERFHKLWQNKMFVSGDDDSVILFNDKTFLDNDINLSQIQHTTGAFVERVPGIGVRLFTEIDEYVFPKWIRMPIIQCIVCMASFYGVFLFLIPVFILSGYNWIALPAYLFNTFSLGAMNKFIFNLVK